MLKPIRIAASAPSATRNSNVNRASTCRRRRGDGRDAPQHCVALSGGWVSRLFTRVPDVIVAGAGYFRAIGLVYGFMAALVVLFSAYQGWVKAVPPLLVSLLRVALVLCGGWIVMQQASPRLDWLYELIAAATVLGVAVLGVTFVLWPAIRSQKPVSG